LPTRLFHWLLVSVFCSSLVSVLYFDDLALHALCGYMVLTLTLFRLVWGFTGGHWSRFSSFIPSFQRSLTFIRQPFEWTQPGHNPLGAWSVWGMLLLLMLQIFSGLCADDDAGFSGPLSVYVSNRVVSLATLYHAEIGKWLLIGLTALHVLAVFFYVLYKRQPLLRAMLTGKRHWPFPTVSANDNVSQRFKAVLIFLVITAVVYVGLLAL